MALTLMKLKALLAPYLGPGICYETRSVDDGPDLLPCMIETETYRVDLRSRDDDVINLGILVNAIDDVDAAVQARETARDRHPKRLASSWRVEKVTLLREVTHVT